jgi:hypothetical protein
MRVRKRPAKRRKVRDVEVLEILIKPSTQTKEKASTLEEAIRLKHEKFKSKTILYPNTIFKFGMYRGHRVNDVLKIDRSYIKFCIDKLNIYISDELSLLYNN